MKMYSSPARKVGFTLIELLVVIAIIGILAAILIPVLSSVRHSSYVSKSSSNLRQLGIGSMAYAAEHQGMYPPPYALNDQQDDLLWSNPWAVTPEITKYFGTEYPGWTAERWPEVAMSGFPVSPRSDLGPGVMTIGMNLSDIYGGMQLLNRKRTSLRQVDIVNPGKTILFAEATDVNINYPARGRWSPSFDENPSGGSAIAYRDKGRALAVTYGGNVISFTREEAEDTAYWFAQP